MRQRYTGQKVASIYNVTMNTDVLHS